MKSFLQEIESKFVELEEATFNVKADQLDKVKDKFDDTDQVNVTELEEDHICERDHPGMTHEEYELKELEEMSTTAGVSGGQGPPKTPYAFAPNKRKMKNRKDKTYNTVQEALDKKYEHLIESYRKFSLGEKNKTPKQTVERTIQEVSRKLKEIETLVEYTKKLKTESGMSRNNYGPRTEKALNRISKKLIKIAERVRAIGE
jgi:hypothetical protein